jgi:dsDNA-binding SOS-regulon protein
MSSTNEENTNVNDMVAGMKQSDEIKKLISDEAIAATKRYEEENLSLKDSDPYGVHEVMPKDKDGNFVKSSEGRSYTKMVDMSKRIDEWLHSNGSFRDTAGQAVKLSFEDAVHSKDMHMLFPKVVANTVIAHSEPISNILSMYEKVRFTNGTQITFPVWSPGGSSVNLYLPETGEPNELTGDLSSFITATTGKVGIKASVTEDTMRFSIIDLYALQLKWCGIALGRFKEKLAVDNLFNAAKANVLFDNVTPANGLVGTGMTNGRNANGARNGTISAYDLFDAYAHGMAQGSDLSTLIIHPLGWRALANNSVMRDRAYNNGGPVWQKAGGSTGRGSAGGSGINKIFKPDWQTAGVGTDEISTTATTMVGVANVFGQPFNIVTSPFAPIREGADVAGAGKKYVIDILMIDPRDVGVHVIDQELYTRQDSKLFDQIKETAFFERYGFGSSNQGHGLFIMKNIVATEGYDFESTPITREVGAYDSVNDTGLGDLDAGTAKT